MLEPPGFPAVQACWSRPVLPPPTTIPGLSAFGSGDPRPYLANLVRCSLFFGWLADSAVVPSIRQLLAVAVNAGDPRSGNLATHLLLPGIGLRLIGSPHRHPGAWRTFHMGRLKGVPFGSLDRRLLYSCALSGCSSVMCTSLRPLKMGLL
ncbi:hypothetical protein SLEP1_g8591 [Rubroshorea leprosula]|uniref:Uncharacterized protein n=1 Tax=Rubroshorea leprosula TaxID=152421 RepID=A0AAV5I892_9ROSI|nr:hypothetical protein SLEP1_g8591 [Rubroshorea leprosula]